MGIIVEQATPEDAAEILAYLKRIGGETDNLNFGSEGLDTTIATEFNDLMQLKDSRDGVLFVAKEHDVIVGDASLSRLPRRMGHRGELGIAVIKTHWNRGIGTQLLRKIIAFAEENSFEQIDLQVRSDNLRAIHLYELHGFQKVCTYPAFFKIGTQLIDFDLMYRTLGKPDFD